jgi:hypothetical protein
VSVQGTGQRTWRKRLLRNSESSSRVLTYQDEAHLSEAQAEQMTISRSSECATWMMSHRCHRIAQWCP